MPWAHSGTPGDSHSEAAQGISCWMLGVPDLAMFCCLLLLPDYSFTHLINSLIQNPNHGYYRSFSRLSKTTSCVPMATAAWDPWLQGQFSASRQPSEQFSSNYPVFFFIFAFLAMSLLPSREKICRSLREKRARVEKERHLGEGY